MTATGLSFHARTLVENPPNARRTMEALREMGYDSYSSILDLIDNALDADATQVVIGVSEESGDIIIEIADNGCGMDEETLSEALRLGSDTSRESGDLGKFGMGLVTASIGLSQRVEVFTRESGGKCLCGGFDLEMIATEDRFVKWIYPASKADGLRLTSEHGTVVRLSNTDRISNRHTTTFANSLRKKIAQTFRKFLKAGTKIEVNRQSIEASDPLMLSHNDTRLLLETDIKIDDSSTASLRVVEVPDFGAAGNIAHGIIPQNSGFYIVRNNREIAEATTFDFYKKHPDFSHFRAEVCFDGSLDTVFHVDVKKMTINPPQGFIDRLRQATQSLITECGREGRKRANASKGQIDHSAAEANITKRASLIPKPKSLVEQRKKRGRKVTNPRTNGERVRNPHVTNLRTISGLKVSFEEADHGLESPFYSVRTSGSTIFITYNREHPFWRELVELAKEPKVITVLDYLVFAMANAELLVPEHAIVVKANVNSTLVGLLV